MLFRSDITSKNEQRKKGFLQNFKIVRQKLVDIEEKDRIRNFQPPVTGDDIMKLFHLQPCREIGSLKMALKDAILDGKVRNDAEEALSFILQRAADMGLQASSEDIEEVRKDQRDRAQVDPSTEKEQTL